MDQLQKFVQKCKKYANKIDWLLILVIITNKIKHFFIIQKIVWNKIYTKFKEMIYSNILILREPNNKMMNY